MPTSTLSLEHRRAISLNNAACTLLQQECDGRGTEYACRVLRSAARYMKAACLQRSVDEQAEEPIPSYESPSKMPIFACLSDDSLDPASVQAALYSNGRHFVHIDSEEDREPAMDTAIVLQNFALACVAHSPLVRLDPSYESQQTALGLQQRSITILHCSYRKRPWRGSPIVC